MEKWICIRCGEELINKDVILDYLGRSFSVELPCCPKCKSVLILPEIATGKMADVEKQLEEK